MSPGERHDPKARVHLDGLENGSQKEAPDQGVTEDRSAPGCKDRFPTADGDGGDNGSRSVKLQVQMVPGAKRVRYGRETVG